MNIRASLAARRRETLLPAAHLLDPLPVVLLEAEVLDLLRPLRGAPLREGAVDVDVLDETECLVGQGSSSKFLPSLVVQPPSGSSST